MDIYSPAESLDRYENMGPYADVSTSPSQSPDISQFDLPLFPEFPAAHTFPSPALSQISAIAKNEQEKSQNEEINKMAKTPCPRRKRENRYKNAPPAVLSRRRAQNRASQRAYRERKDQRIRDLEVMLEKQKQKNEELMQAYDTLNAKYTRLSGSSPSPSHAINTIQEGIYTPYTIMAQGQMQSGSEGLGIYHFQQDIMSFPM